MSLSLQHLTNTHNLTGSLQSMFPVIVSLVHSVLVHLGHNLERNTLAFGRWMNLHAVVFFFVHSKTSE